jgi:hypothetical protein
MEITQVLAFGDSNVAGCELAPLENLQNYLNGQCTLEEVDSIGKKFAFPQIVADSLGVKCYNFALSGGSNTRSLRKLITNIKDCRNSLILFGYTEPNRTEFYYPDKGDFLARDSDNFIQVGIQWEQSQSNRAFKWFQKQSSKNFVHPINKVYLEKILRPYDNLNDILVCVDAVCKISNNQVIHIPICQSLDNTSYNILDLEGHGYYNEWCKQNKFQQLPLGHYGQEAHNKLSELILKNQADL